MPKQFSCRNNSYIIHISAGFLSLCLLLIALFCLLGAWQIHRYHDKQTLLKIYQQRLQSLPRPFALLSGDIKDFQFQPVVVEGEFMNAFSILIQNRMYQSKLGYEVMTPIRVVGSHQWLLVDRGWLQKEREGSVLSLVPIVGKHQFMGYINLLDEYQFTLGKNILDPAAKPWVMQKIDLEELRKMTKHDFYPFILRLDASDSYGFVRDWTISVMPPERHQMYALQWFVLAIVIFIGYLSFCIERVKLS